MNSLAEKQKPLNFLGLSQTLEFLAKNAGNCIFYE
jgi:hypothetical protein